MDKDDDLAWDEKDEDWDEVGRNLIVEKKKKERIEAKQQVVKIIKNTEEDGNYNNSSKPVVTNKQQQKNIQPQSSANNQDDYYVQPLSNKELTRIKNFTKSTSTFHNLLFETYGNFDKFMLTHEEELNDENIVELLNIDIALLSIPFDNHNMFLLKRICKLPIFWDQLLNFVDEFLISKHKNLSFLFLVDMKTFFINLEIMYHKILVNDLMNSSMEMIFKNLIKLLENKNEWAKPSRYLEIKAEHKTNKNVLEIYDVSLIIIIYSQLLTKCIILGISNTE